MTVTIPFDNSYARLPATMFAHQRPHPVSAPTLIAYNSALASHLGITGDTPAELATVFGGNLLPDGASPLAQLYAGHQFGGFSPQLGDGRAVLLGEVVDQSGTRQDIQLKGSGPTPFARRGDGRAWLGPVLREYVVSEAMHALSIPTTRALAAVRTGDDVIREKPLPGAVLTRVASSHIRVGTFQVFAARGMLDELRALFEYARDRHYPDASDPSEFLSCVIHAQADLVARWMAVGFIHGVMNTDNCTISGETIDYGPCAFMDSYDPETVFSSIDRWGRYAYAAQADIIVWNMAQLATSLAPLMPSGETAVAAFQPQINAMPDLIRAAWLRHFAAKLGLSEPRPDDTALISDLLGMMHAAQADFTNTFRALTETGSTHLPGPEASQWHKRWQARIANAPQAEALMQGTNPALIPRNHQIEAMITAAQTGDDTPFHRLNTAYAQPFDSPVSDDDLRHAPTPDQEVEATFCGT